MHPDLQAFAASAVIDAYVARVCARPAFERARAAQLAHFAAADAARSG